MGIGQVASKVGARRSRAIVGLVTIGVLIAACTSGSSTSASPAASQAASQAASPNASAALTVKVALQEFAVLPNVASVPAGTVTFVANNTGPEDVHELVVIKTDLGALALPVDAQGKVTEEAAGLTVIGEVKDVAVGATKQVDLVLAPGKYVLICNILQTEPDGSLESHYKVGMTTAFEVTGS